MSGGSVAYNLRPNKYVERQLFVELLDVLYPGDARKKLVYISFGGPQLEDHKLVHHVLGITNLISLEMDEGVYRRQIFNLKPYIDCKIGSTADIPTIRDAAPLIDMQAAIWLDYTDPKQRRVQLQEYQNLLTQRCFVGDTIKITLNANPSTLGDNCQDEETDDEKLERRYQNLKASMRDYLPQETTAADMTSARFQKILCGAILQATSNGLKYNPDSTLDAIPVAIFSYQDVGHRMLTFTVHIAKSSDKEARKQALRDAGWKFLPTGWQDVTFINIPNLTPKERLHIDSLLYRNGQTIADIHDNLGFTFDAKKTVSLEMLEEYELHYRRYPSLMSVVL